MGRKPKPAEIKAAAGNPGKRKNNIVPKTEVPVAGIKPPPGLTPEAQRVWKEMSQSMSALGFLRISDTAVFGVFCQTLADYREIVKRIRKEGRTYKVKSRHGEYIRPHPLSAEKERCARIIIQYASDFGITPAARQKLQAVLPPNLPAAGLFAKDDDEKQNAARDPITYN